MIEDLIKISDLVITNALLVWLAHRIVRKVDQLDTKLDSHEVRLTIAEKELASTKKI